MILSCVTCGDPCQSPRTTCGKTGCLSESRKPKRIARLGKKKAAALALAGKPWPRSSITASRKARKKKASNFKRQFHSVERVEFVKSLPCAACGVVGYSENAHLTPKSEKGTGYKGGWEFIAPLCGERWNGDSFEIGCHTLFDEHRWQFDIEFPDFDSEQAARQTEKLWNEHQEQEEG